MRFIMFRTPQPKQFSYKPRYYDEEKERMERRKAEMGYESKLSHGEGIIYYLFYAVVILGGIYVIFFTGFVDKLVALFGVGN